MTNYNELQSGQILTGSAVLGAGKSTVITTEAMASRSLRWLRCEELSVEIYPQSSPIFGLGQTLAQQSMGSFVTIKPTAYREGLTNDYFPLWLMGPRPSIQAEKVVQPLDLANNVDFFGPYETYRWKFAKPFYMPPGGAFLVQAQRNGNALDLAYTTNINIKVALRCTQMTEKQAKAAMQKNGGNPLPYASSFVPTSYPAQSADLTFKNQFQVPLYVQRITGRCAGNSALLVYTQNQGGVDFLNAAQVQLWDTRTLVSDKVPFSALFSKTSMAWTFTRMLKPSDYLTARLETTNTDACNPQVAIVGYRNEEIP